MQGKSKCCTFRAGCLGGATVQVQALSHSVQGEMSQFAGRGGDLGS